jgi:hypothetical protein
MISLNRAIGSLATRDRLQIYFLIAIPLIVLGVGEVSQQRLIEYSAIFPFVKPDATVPACGKYETTEFCAQTLSGELLYGGFWFLNIIMAITATSVGASTLLSNYGTSKSTSGLIFAVALGAILSSIALKFGNTLEPILRHTLNGFSDIPPFRDRGATLLAMLKFTYILVPVSASIMAVACLRTAYRMQRPMYVIQAGTAAAHLYELQERTQALKRVTMVAALLLVTSVLEYQFYLKLPIPYLQYAAAPTAGPSTSLAPPTPPTAAPQLGGGTPMTIAIPPNGANGYKSLIDGITSVQGIEYTTLLMVVFGIPAIFIHHNALLVARVAAPTTTPPTTSSKYLEGFGLEFSVPTYFADVITVAMPAIAASVSPLVRIATGSH